MPVLGHATPLPLFPPFLSANCWAEPTDPFASFFALLESFPHDMQGKFRCNSCSFRFRILQPFAGDGNISFADVNAQIIAAQKFCGDQSRADATVRVQHNTLAPIKN